MRCGEWWTHSGSETGFPGAKAQGQPAGLARAIASSSIRADGSMTHPTCNPTFHKLRFSITVQQDNRI
jgi:hypothetical protein